MNPVVFFNHLFERCFPKRKRCHRPYRELVSPADIGDGYGDGIDSSVVASVYLNAGICKGVAIFASTLFMWTPQQLPHTLNRDTGFDVLEEVCRSSTIA